MFSFSSVYIEILESNVRPFTTPIPTNIEITKNTKKKNPGTHALSESLHLNKHNNVKTKNNTVNAINIIFSS